MDDPQFIQFLLSIVGAAALLIWAVRLVRTGVERGFASTLRLWLRRSSDNRFLALATGTGAAVLLQSSTAVAVLVSNFVSRGRLTAAVGLAILLGADVGSAIVTQLLIVKQDFLIPLALLLGVALFLRGQGNIRQVGRILIGLALILVSLDMIRAATGPVISSEATRTAMAYLGRDLMTAFVLGAGFAWIVHSSVAAILLFVTLAGQGLLPIPAAAAMILGANLGGAFIAFFLTLSAPSPARRMVSANVMLRGGGAILVTYLISIFPDLLGNLGSSATRQTINLHLVFNLVLTLLALPFVGPLVAALGALIPDVSSSDAKLDQRTALDPSALDRPKRALACASRELLGMGQKIEQMLVAIEPLYDNWNATSGKLIQEQDTAIKAMNLEIKLYLAQLGQKELDEVYSRRALELASLSASLASASDAISRVMVDMAERLNRQQLAFSQEGRREICEFSDRIQNNVQLALNVMMQQDHVEARELVAAKEEVREVEQKLQRSHIERLREGQIESIDTSNIHQETLRALKQVNTAFSLVGIVILEKSGDLLESRLTES